MGPLFNMIKAIWNIISIPFLLLGDVAKFTAIAFRGVYIFLCHTTAVLKENRWYVITMFLLTYGIHQYHISVIYFINNSSGFLYVICSVLLVLLSIFVIVVITEGISQMYSTYERLYTNKNINKDISEIEELKNKNEELLSDYKHLKK